MHCPAAASWQLVFEFKIPRRQKRPDLVLLADDLIFVIEMKIGATRFTAQDRWRLRTTRSTSEIFTQVVRSILFFPCW